MSPLNRVITQDGRVLWNEYDLLDYANEHGFDLEDVETMASWVNPTKDDTTSDIERELEGIIDCYHSMSCEVINLCEELQAGKRRVSARDFASEILLVIYQYM